MRACTKQALILPLHFLLLFCYQCYARQLIHLNHDRNAIVSNQRQADI